MDDDDDPLAVRDPAVDELPQIEVAAVVESVVGLIEKKKLRVVGYRERNVQLVALAARQLGAVMGRLGSR